MRLDVEARARVVSAAIEDLIRTFTEGDGSSAPDRREDLTSAIVSLLAALLSVVDGAAGEVE